MADMKKPAPMIARAALSAMLALLPACCSMPPYNEELSLAQVTRAKLGTPVNRIGPIYHQIHDSAEQSRYFFLPNRDDPVNSGGFLAAASTYGLRLWYLADFSSVLENSWSIPVDNSDEATFNYLLESIESTGGRCLLSLTRNLPNDLRTIASIGPSPSSVVQPTGEIFLASTLGVPGVDVVGSSIFADVPVGSDPQFFLGYSSGATAYYEFAGQTDAVGPGFTLGSTGLPTTLGGQVPSGLSSAFYAHDPLLDRSYLSYRTGSSYATCAWTWNHDNPGIDASGFQQLAGVKGRVEAVLNNGLFLAMDKAACAVYQPSGQKLYDFPLGGLRFCFERWDFGENRYKVYFSLAYWIYGRNDKPDQLYVEVYALPSDSLNRLD
jgi:hypothetical protein